MAMTMIRILVSSESSLKNQFDMVKQFAEKRLLPKLNITKYEISCVYKEATTYQSLTDMDGVVVPYLGM